MKIRRLLDVFDRWRGTGKFVIFAIFVVALVCGFLMLRAFGGYDRTGLYVDLLDEPVYMRQGFDADALTAVPEVGDWVKIDSSDAANRKTLSVTSYDFGGGTKHPFSLRDAPPEEFTAIMSFYFDAAKIDVIRSDNSAMPAVFFASLGDNWEIYLNGRLIRSEMHLDRSGRILEHRTMRNLYFPVEADYFEEGLNVIAIRIVGPPNYELTGFGYVEPYFIDEFSNIISQNSEYLSVAFCAIYIFIGVYYLLSAVFGDEARQYVFFALFTIIIGAYFLTRTVFIYRFIPDTYLLLRIEYASVYLVLPMVAFSFEVPIIGRIRRATKLYGAFCGLLAVLSFFSSMQMNETLLRIWQASGVVAIVIIALFDVILPVIRHAAELRGKAAEDGRKQSGLNALGQTLLNTFQGNMLAGVFLIMVSSIHDIVDAVFLHTGVHIVQYSFFVFSVCASFVLIRKSANLQKTLNLAKQKLENSNAELEFAVQERTSELEIQSELAISASKAKSDFLATMSHEMRTPLNAIIGLSEIELAKQVESPSAESLEKIYNSGSILLSLINQILDISKIESGKFELNEAEYSLAELVGDVIDINVVRNGKTAVDFVVDIDETLPDRLVGDALRVKQILNNLLSNAFKFTEQGSVHLRLSRESGKGNGGFMLCAEVSDTGIGIRKEDIGKLFYDYAQVGATTNHAQGTGLGLYICRQLCDLMGGNIAVESEYAKGTTFKVRLKQGVAGRRLIGPETRENLKELRSGRPKEKAKVLERAYMPYGRVLVVDDVQTNLDVVCGLLEPYGIEADYVLSGAEALELTEAGTEYDVIFMDYMMPVMDGMETVQKIRALDTDYTKRVPIVALTANAVIGNAELLLHNGFNAFLPKPISTVKLDAVLVKYILKKQTAETLAAAERQRPEAAPVAAGSALRWPYFLDAVRAVSEYGGAAAYLDVLRSFVKHTPQLLISLRSPSAETLADCAMNAHGLKGAARGAYIAVIGDLAEATEHAAKAGAYKRTRDLAAELTETADRTLALLGDFLTETADDTEKTLSAELDAAVLKDLYEAALTYKTTQVDELTKVLCACRYERDADNELADWLREQAEDLEYEAIAERLNGLFDA
ncbi:MAG: response regulator [Oscillospiraceae bacterium]|nr:response regulator [Oscillospiraceae bacterium]